MASDGVGGSATDVEEGWRSRAPRFPDYGAVVTPPPSQLQMLASSAPVQDRDRLPYAGSGGGKWKAARKNTGRKSSLPYERPVIVRHAPADSQAAAFLDVTSAQALAGKRPGGGAWLGSGISKIITSSATYLYSSIFRRRLPAPVQVSNAEALQLDGEEQVSSPSAEAEGNQAGNGRVTFVEDHEFNEMDAANSSSSELDSLLKKKTLSRDEFERLTTLLQTRVVGNGVEKKQPSRRVEFDTRPSGQESQPSPGIQSEAQRWRQDLQKSREERENGLRTLTVYENGGPSTSTPAGVSEALDSLNSSPVEVAIAFMGGRASRQVGATSPLEPLTQRDENRLASGPPSSLQTSEVTLAKWARQDFLHNDQFHTPPPPALPSWGRNRTLSRTPYSRPLRLQPYRERAVDGTFGVPSATRWTPIRTPVTGGREMLKRRSTVLDDGWTSGGPIRRTRQKALTSVGQTNLSQSRGSSYPVVPIPGSSLLTLSSSMEESFVGVTPSQRNVAAAPAKENDILTPSGNFYVPAQSSETARKILETLEKMTPSPRGKSLGEELAHVRDKVPATLTESMLNDQARKSMAVVEYPVPNDSREPGPSTRSLEKESPGIAHSGNAVKTPDYSTKVKGKGKASLPSSESGPGALGGLSGLQAQERSVADGAMEQISLRVKEPETKVSSDVDKCKGFRMSAVFEESGSEDEGRLSNTSLVPPSLPISTGFKLPSLTPKSSTVSSSVFTIGTSCPDTTATAGLSTAPVGAPGIDTTRTVTSGFTFPTRPSLEGPPTPKAMSPATTSPKAAPPVPFFEFAQTVQPVAATGSAVEQTSITVKAADSKIESKAEFSFSSPSTPTSEPTSTAVQQSLKLQPSVETSNLTPFKQSSPFSGGPSSSVAPITVSTVSSAGAASSSPAGPAPAQASSNLGGALSIAPNTAAPFKAGAMSSNASLFVASSSSIVFGSASASVGNVAATASLSSFTSSVFGTSSSGSTFGVAPAAPIAFGSTPNTPAAPIAFGSTPTTPAAPIAFGSTTSSKPLFAGFVPEPASQPQSTPMFASGFTSPSIPLFGSGSASVGNSTATTAIRSFTTSAFGTSTGGSSFGATPAASIAFGTSSTTLAFGSTTAKPVFGSFSPEPISQSPSTPVFGSGFTSPSLSTSPFSFGASSPAFSFGAGPASSSSGAAFPFSSASSFPFSSNKSVPPSLPPSIFGLSNSTPAFGSTTNGTMANDVVVNDLSNMDDNSMAEEPPQIGGNVSPQPTLFGAQSSAGTGPFVFGAQMGAPGASGPTLFGGFPPQSNPAGFTATANPFAAPQPGGSLDFSAGSFALGSGGDRPARKLFKAKRTGAKRGK